MVALPLIALQVTRSPLLIAGLTVAARLPWLLFSLVAGVVADRVDRRRVLVGVNAVRALLIGTAALLTATGNVELWMLYLLALLLGVAETLFDTSAQSALPALVSRAEIGRANSRLYGVEVVANTFVGPPLGGLLVAASAALALAGSSLAYAAAALALLAMTGSFRAVRTGPRTSLATDIAEGVTYLWRHPVLRLLALLVGGVSLTNMAFYAVLPVFAVAPGPMDLNEQGYGLLLGSIGVGALLASLTAERVARRLGPSRALRVCIVTVAATAASPLLVHPVAVGAALALGAFFVVVWNVITVSWRQQVVPDHLLGRVNSVYRLLAWGAGPLGALGGGVLAEVTSVRVTFICAAVGTLALLLAMGSLDDAKLSADPPEPGDD